MARLADMAPRGSDDGGGIVKSPYAPGTYFVQKQEWVVRASYTSTSCLYLSGHSIPTLSCDMLHILYLFRNCCGIIFMHAIEGVGNACLSPNVRAGTPGVCKMLAALLNLMHL